jgi:hypothetical protein
MLEPHEPLLKMVVSRGLRCFLTDTPTGLIKGGYRVDFGQSPLLDPRLRDRSLEEQYEGPFATLVPDPGDEVVASSGGQPLWMIRRQGGTLIDIVACGLEELDENEGLWNHLRGMRFITVLPLIHFLRQVTADIAWTPPPLRANIHFDDPNLHWTSYGYIDYPELARHAYKHNYHASMAIIPLDTYFAFASAARIFQEHGAHLSLLIHGLNHMKREMAVPLPHNLILSILAEALHRIAVFEKRYRIPVCRVMAPPYGVCSTEMVRGMLLLGYEAVVLGKPYPFVDWNAPAPGLDPLAGCCPADFVMDGFPVIKRHSINYWAQRADRQGDIVLRAFLDQPIIFFAHHNELSGGLDILAHVARHVNSFGPVQWQPLSAICRSNYSTRRDGETFYIRLFSRHVKAMIPEGIEHIFIQKGQTTETGDSEFVIYDGSPVHLQSEGLTHVSVPKSFSREVEIELRYPNTLDHRTVPTTSFSFKRIARRVLMESRDRLMPIFNARNWSHRVGKYDRREYVD